MDGNVLAIAAKFLTADVVAGKAIVDVGSYNVNGSLHSIVDPLVPASYLGVDIEPGPDVDVTLDGADLYKTYGQVFDVVLCASCLEHCKDWRAVWASITQALKPGGHLLISVPTAVFPPHDYRGDYWRFNKAIILAAAMGTNMASLYCELDPAGHNVHFFGQRLYGDISLNRIPGAIPLNNEGETPDDGSVPTAPFKLDIGCGVHWKEPHSEWTHLDYFPSEHTEIVCDFNEIPLDTESVDVIWVGDVIEHIPVWDLARTLGEWNRILKMGGQFGGSTVNLDWAMYAYPHGQMTLDWLMCNLYGWRSKPQEQHYQVFTREHLIETLAIGGFTNVDLTESPGDPKNPWWWRFYATKTSRIPWRAYEPGNQPLSSSLEHVPPVEEKRVHVPGSRPRSRKVGTDSH